MTVLVRERPSLRHSFEIETPTGRRYRWGPDEPLPDSVLNDWSGSSTMPGGFEQFGGTLPRRPGRDYADLERLSTLLVHGAGGSVVGEYRLQASPRSSGDQFAITPSAVGWQAHLDDDKSVVAIYVDIDKSRWAPTSVSRRINYGPVAVQDSSVTPDATGGLPALAVGGTGPWTAASPLTSEAWYDAGPGITIGSVYHAWQRNANVDSADPNWTWEVLASVNDQGTSASSTGNLRAAGPSSGTLTPAAGKRFAAARLAYAAVAAGADGTQYLVWFTCLAVYGDHALTKRGTASTTDAQGFYASDIVAHAVGKWAPQLAFSTGPGGTIEPSSFVIPQAAFLEPTTAAEIVKQATRFDLQDWAVWEGPTFYWHSRGARGKKWRARVGPTKLQETGPSADRLYNSVVVRYQDVTGAARTVGPPGSGADVTDATLVDTDPDNPCNRLGITRRGLLSMQTSTPAGAVQVGGRFLAEQKLLDRSGSATLTGHVIDDRGVLWPASRVRAGDSIVFTDAADVSERRIVKASYNDRDKTCAVDLDAPPQALDALLERLSVVLVPLGVS